MGVVNDGGEEVSEKYYKLGVYDIARGYKFYKMGRN